MSSCCPATYSSFLSSSYDTTINLSHPHPSIHPRPSLEMSELAAVLAKQRRRSEAGLVHESTPEKSSADAQHGSIQKSTPDQMIVKPVEDHDGTYFDQAGSELKTILERRRRRSEVGATAAYVTPSESRVAPPGGQARTDPSSSQGTQRTTERGEPPYGRRPAQRVRNGP